jgi:hypothetical protein
VKRFFTSLPFTYDTLTAKMAVFCHHRATKERGASYPFSL